MPIKEVKPKEDTQENPQESFRIKDALSEPALKKAEVKTEVSEEISVYAEEEAFDREQLLKSLEDYIRQNKPEKIMVMALTTYPPRITGEQITFCVDNLLQKEKLEAQKTPLRHFLIKALHNGKVDCTIEVRQSQEVEGKRLVTAQSKLEHFIQLNPTISDMQRIFGLELE